LEGTLKGYSVCLLQDFFGYFSTASSTYAKSPKGISTNSGGKHYMRKSQCPGLPICCTMHSH